MTARIAPQVWIEVALADPEIAKTLRLMGTQFAWSQQRGQRGR